MDLGFQTCGNATLIAYDHGEPVVVTDPWVRGLQYFGSWSLPYCCTPDQEEAFSRAKYVWLSHGHPDHLNLDSLSLFKDKVLLVPQHYGGRIASDLRGAGFQVHDLRSGEWLQLSKNVRLLCYADWNQDAAVLVALGDRCGVLNLNDGRALGTRAGLAKELKQFRRRFVLRLVTYGDADMMNFFTESGERIKPMAGEKKPLGYEYSALLKRWGGTHTAPFSCHHMYARKDSQWASTFETPLAEHGSGFKASVGEFIPAYFSYDVATDRITPTPMERTPREFHEPGEFGDDWSEPLEHDDVQALNAYFGKFEHLREKFEFLNFRVGGRDHTVDLGGPRGYGITFEAPRASLMTAVRYEIFDDLLIGNFMKTTLHGGLRSLYPDFTPYVAKYGDNGRAFTNEQLQDYFLAYRRAAGLQGWIDHARIESARKVRLALSANRSLYLFARRVYGHLKS